MPKCQHCDRDLPDCYDAVNCAQVAVFVRHSFGERLVSAATVNEWNMKERNCAARAELRRAQMQTKMGVRAGVNGRKLSPLTVQALNHLRESYTLLLADADSNEVHDEAARKIAAIDDVIASQDRDPKNPHDVLTELAEFSRRDALFTEMCNRPEPPAGLREAEDLYRAAANELFHEIMGRPMNDEEFGRLCSM